jgi:hypothetical protein
VVLDPCAGSSGQAWAAVKSGSNYTFHPANNTALCLDVVSAGTASGTLVDAYTCNATSAQSWALSTPGSGGGTGTGTTINNVYVTLYGWPDNSPPGNAIAYPGLYSVATQGQTYALPGTFATDALSNGELKPQTIIYNPHFQKYFILEDECVGCEADWASGNWHIDLWVGGNPPANSTDVINCEDSLTTSGQTIIENPPNNEPVNTTPLYNSSTNACW